MSTTWTQPAQTLISEATAGWEGIWSLTYAAGFAALNLAMSVPLGVGVSISYAAMDFRDAQDELEWARPNLRATAAEQIRIGAGELRTDRFWSADEALAAIGDFHAVLDAVASHTRRLLWPAQIQRIGFTSHRDGLPANERAAIALAAGIEALVGEARPHPSQLSPATTPWLRAAPPGSGYTASCLTSSPSPRHTRPSATTSSPSAACCPPSHRLRPARAAQHSRTRHRGASARASTARSRP